MADNNRWEGQLIQYTRDNRRLVVASRWALKAGSDGSSPSILETNNEMGEQQQADDLLLAAEQQADVLLVTAQKQAQLVLTVAQQTRFDQRPKATHAEVERLLAQKEQAEILDLSHDAIILRDLDGTVRYWNRGAKEIYGYTKEEAIGQNLAELVKSIYPKPLKEIELDLTVNSRWEGKLLQLTKDKAKVVVSARWALKTDSQGRPVSILSVNSDITAQDDADAVLAAAQQQAAEVLATAQRQAADLLLLAAQQQASVVLLAAEQQGPSRSISRATNAL